MAWSALMCGALSWIIGIFLDANISITPSGFFMFRVILPMFALAFFILQELKKG